MPIDQAILVRSKTRLEQLVERFNSREQARFYIERSGGNFSEFVEEDKRFYASMERVRKTLSPLIRYKQVDRSFLPSFIFSDNQMVVVLGQDGLLANTAKYVGDRPIIGVNPDPDRYDGALLSFESCGLKKIVPKVQREEYDFKTVTMAEARLQDGQRLLAFNDLFIGPGSHVSARYRLSQADFSERQSSSGILVATGAGSTGWLSSVFQMAKSVNRLVSGHEQIHEQTMSWDTDHLMYVVREPFLSLSSSVDYTSGKISASNPLKIESHMPQNGIIFSDGIESDFLNFNAGAVARIGLAQERARIVSK